MMRRSLSAPSTLPPVKAAGGGTDAEKKTLAAARPTYQETVTSLSRSVALGLQTANLRQNGRESPWGMTFGERRTPTHAPAASGRKQTRHAQIASVGRLQRPLNHDYAISPLNIETIQPLVDLAYWSDFLEARSVPWRRIRERRRNRSSLGKGGGRRAGGLVDDGARVGCAM